MFSRKTNTLLFAALIALAGLLGYIGDGSPPSIGVQHIYTPIR